MLCLSGFELYSRWVSLNKRTFVGRFFELFTLPASLRLNTERRSAPSMRAFKEEEWSVLISVTLMKGIQDTK